MAPIRPFGIVPCLSQTPWLSIRHFILTVVMLISICSVSESVPNLIETPFWRLTEQWSDCSTLCGPGTVNRQYQCVTSDIFDILTILNDSLCDSLSRPVPSGGKSIEKPCNMGSCYGYRWRVSEWGHCSQMCGAFGSQTRDVDCVYVGSHDHEVVVRPRDANYYCGHYSKPEPFRQCNRIACQPEFLPEKWAKCIQHDPCRPGRQVRTISCVSIQINGTQRILPKAACYRYSRPTYPTWRRCFSASSDRCENQIPAIDTDSKTIVQMRKAKLLNLKIGQSAFVIPYTRLIIECPVHYFSVHELVWSHPHYGSVTYGNPKENRISVDKRGRLRIQSFRQMDVGDWKCNAANKYAEISLNARTPADGFHDWVQRNRLWTKGMMSDDPKDLATVHAIVQWVEGPWSACSVDCGDAGEQFRTVRCERVDTRFYQILDDQACLDKLLPKPLSKRKCLKSKECPSWVVQDTDESVCTDRCLGVNQGSIKGNLSCRIGQRVVEETQCELSEKPDMSCPNTACQVEWQVGEWSQCSKFCGGVGVRARQLVCIWVHNKQPAGPLCYANQLATPMVIEECEAPPCKLDCIDLSQHCPTRLELCKFTFYRFQCCASCKNHYYRLTDERNLQHSASINSAI